jgi:ribosomal protein S18 acetylase RimI-like enzyme
MGATCEPILRSLPDWFGIEEAVIQYVQEIDGLPTWLASVGNETAGFLTIKQHNPFAAEILVMGVRRSHQRHGAGRALVLAAEQELRQQGVQFLQVKTLSASHPDENYARTRAFYFAVGFRPLEEIASLWGPANPCLLMVKSLL